MGLILDKSPRKREGLSVGRDGEPGEGWVQVSRTNERENATKTVGYPGEKPKLQSPTNLICYIYTYTYYILRGVRELLR